MASTCQGRGLRITNWVRKLHIPNTRMYDARNQCLCGFEKNRF